MCFDHDIQWYTRCTIKNCSFVAQVRFFQPSLLYLVKKASGQMATVTGYPFPIPADELGPFIVTLRTFQMGRQTQNGCDQCWESSVNPHILQWRLLCFYSMTTVSKYKAILLGMDWHLLCNDQFSPSIKRFYIVFSFLCSLPDSSIAHA